jgi:thiamine pyrophosphate-dependent acetolactate synthase large subunit-like protein
MAAGDHDRNYYLWAAMGSAATVGLGLAMSRPKEKVLVVTGDGEMLMGMGALATIAVQSPKNLSIAVLDNGHYGETGMQDSHAGLGVGLERVSESLDFDYSACISDMDALRDFRRRIHAGNALNFATVKVDTAEEARVLPSRDGVYIKHRLQAALASDG